MYNAKRSVMVFETCPDPTFDRELREKCENETTGFEPDPFLHIPVYSAGNNHSKMYKNKYCAICDFQNERDLVYWKLNIKCFDQQDNFVFGSLENLFSLVQENSTLCNIIYTKPIDGREFYCWMADVDSCPQNADPFYSKACGLYTSIYAPAVSTKEVPTYKNIFCYLCNGHSVTDAPNRCRHTILTNRNDGPANFIALLDFNALVSSSDPSGSTECTGLQKYDENQVCM